MYPQIILSWWTFFVFLACISWPRMFGRTEQATGFVAGVNLTICVYTLASIFGPLLKAIP